MPEIELERPDTDDVDASAPTFRRRIALAVVLITLFGAMVGYLQQRASNLEDNAARDAQIAAINGLGTQVEATTDFRSNFQIFVESELLDRRFIEASNRQRSAPPGSPEAERFGLEATRWAAVRDSIVPLTRLSEEDFLNGNEVDPFLLEAELEVEPDEARLEQGVLADRADDFGGKADSYVAVLAVLAVALFLLGLSLTVTPRARTVLVIPGLAIGVLAVGWTVMVAVRDTTEVSDQAIRITADGGRLAAQGDFDAAIDRYDRAIDISPEFAAAYQRRSDAHFTAGATQTATGFISFVTDEARDRSIADGERALELGASDVNLVANLGFTLFLDGQFDRAAELTEQALEGNDDLAFLWFNEGVIELARGNDDAAREAYDEGMGVLADEPDPFVRSQILSAARNDLVLLRDLAAAADDRADEIEGELAAFEAELTPPTDDSDFADDVADADGDEEIDDITVERSTSDPVFIDAFVGRGDLDDDTPLALFWYYRTSDDDPFEQLPGMKNFARAGSDEELVFSATLDECLPAGEYRVDVYSGTSRLGTGEGEVEAGPLGIVTNSFSEVDGVSVCVPEDWESTRLSGELTGTEQDGPLFISPDGGTLVGITSFSTSVEERATPDATMRDTVETLVGLDVPIESDTILATDGEEFFQIPAMVGLVEEPDSVSLVVASLAPEPDGVLRVVIVIAPDLELAEAVRTEMIDTLLFHQVRRA